MTDKFDKKDFFAWCASKGLNKPEEIAVYFRLSGQTIRNWEKDMKSGDPERLRLAKWVHFTCVLYDASAGADGRISPSEVEDQTFDGLKEWQNSNNFKTYESTGEVFGIKRQAVHLWHKRQKIPSWVALACAGYPVWKKTFAK